MTFRIRSILAATDLSEIADDAVRAAIALADLTGAPLHLIRALEPGYQVPGAEGNDVDTQRRTHEARLELESHLQRRVPRADRAASEQVYADRAHTAILRRAAEVEADLIVLGPHRDRVVGDRVLGTTADRVIRTSEVPCLIVPGPVSLPLRQILVPTDLSEPARTALEVALTWGAALRTPSSQGGGTELTLLHVAPRPAGAGEDGSELVEREMDGQIEQAVAREAGGSTSLEVRRVILNADSAPDAILRLADEMEADLLVIGTRGRGAVEHALLGSVSSSVARRADCPVLLVPPGYRRGPRAVPSSAPDSPRAL